MLLFWSSRYFVGFYSVWHLWNLILFGFGGQESLDLAEAARDHARQGSIEAVATLGGGCKQGQTGNFADRM